jgi:hypothetical protein
MRDDTTSVKKTSEICVGSRVKIVGLKNAAQYNDCKGKVIHVCHMDLNKVFQKITDFT